MQLQANAQMNIPVSCMNDWTIENSCLLISVHKDSPPYNKTICTYDMKVM